MPSLLSTYRLAPRRAGTLPSLSKRPRLCCLANCGLWVTTSQNAWQSTLVIRSWSGYGVVGVLKNGQGPTVYVRTELDALPVEEMTGLPYASKVRTKDDAGREVAVGIRACGHDIHITSLLGTAKVLAETKDQWHGTLVMLAQPAEEAISGAKAMLDDGLYTRFPQPDFVIALHDTPALEAGKVGFTPGYAMASSTSVEVTLRGIGGHGSAPQAAKDPIVEAAEFILAIQTIVSREDSPFDPAVVTVGSIHGGTRPNIIPDEVRLQLTIRTYKEEVRQHILEALTRMAKAIATAHGIPPSLSPTVTADESDHSPALVQRSPTDGAAGAGLQEGDSGPENVVESAARHGQ